MIRLATILGVGLLLAAALPAAANDLSVENQPIELKNLKTGKQVLDPAKGYIFLTAPGRFSAAFTKTPEAEDFAAYEEAWAEAFAKARERYEKRIASYESKKAKGLDPGEKPEEPTEENFAIGAIEQSMMAWVGPMYIYDKGKTASGEKFFHYLQEVEPGTYTFYGPLFFDPSQGALGSCYCMGSWKFEVKAGEITSLGDFLTESWADDAAVKQANLFFQPNPDRVLKPTDWSVPASLDALPSVKAELSAAGKMNNFYRVNVVRSPPIPGVLRYERDTVIDVKAELAAAEEARLEAERAEAAAKAEAEAEAEAEAAAREADGAVTPSGEESAPAEE